MTGLSGDLWSTLIDGNSRRRERDSMPPSGGSSMEMLWRPVLEAKQDFVSLVDVKVQQVSEVRAPLVITAVRHAHVIRSSDYLTVG